MKLKFSSKSQEFEADGTVKGTKVILTNDEGAIYPVMLPADKISLSNDELEKLALEVIYQDNFPNRAENEKFNEIGEKIAKYDELIEKSQKAIKELEQATEEAKQATQHNQETVNLAVSELTELVMSLINSASTDEETGSEEQEG